VVAYSELSRAIAAGQVGQLLVDAGGTRVEATLRTKQLVNGQVTGTVVAALPARSISTEVLEKWTASGARVQVAAPDGVSGEQALQLASFFLLVGVIGFAALRQRGGVAKHRFSATPASRRLTLNDVGGAQEARADLRT
jgi:hypothetical protein